MSNELPAVGLLPSTLIPQIEAILSPAIDVRAPYARQMVQALADLFAAQLTTLAQARDEYRTLAKIGTWHNDCRPNRQQAVREIEKSQAVINKLADRISELEAQVAAQAPIYKCLTCGSADVYVRSAAQAQEREPPMKQCEDFCPPTWTGHWRDWHRGHGCHLDPTLAAQERETTPDAVAAFIRDVRDEALRLHRTYKHLSSAALIQEAFDRRAGEHFWYRPRTAAPDVPPLAAQGSGPTPDAGGT